jgi:hypothetical protein
VDYFELLIISPDRNGKPAGKKEPISCFKKATEGSSF